MRLGITRLMIVVGMTGLLLAASSVVFAQTCPTSPDYTTDFSSNQNCLTLTGNSLGYPGFYAPVPPPPPGVTNVLRITPNATGIAGSAWFNTQQPVSGVFSSTFTFQLSGGNTEFGPADGFAFVIQNSAQTALGPDGCGIGFGGSSSGCTSNGGIPNSLAVEFNTFQNPGDPSSNFVSIQTCLTGANSVDPGTCRIAINSTLPITLGDGNVHSVTVNYSGPSTKLLDVIVDGNDLFPGGVLFDLTTIGINNGNAWVGFTAATGRAYDNQDILSWTFQPQSQTAVINQNTETDLTFPNASGNNVYNYNAQLNAPYATPVITISRC